MVKMGIEPGRLSAKGFGSQKPVTDNSTAKTSSQQKGGVFKSISVYQPILFDKG